jgi:hypothetical protein
MQALFLALVHFNPLCVLNSAIKNTIKRTKRYLFSKNAYLRCYKRAN